MGLFFPLVLVAAAAVLAAIIYFKKPPASRPLPELKALALEPLSEQGGKLALEDLNGQVVLLNFWGTWCPPCLKEFPDVVELEKQYRQREGVRVVAVSCGPPGSDDAGAELKRLRENTQAFLDRHSVEMPMYLDPSSKTRQAVSDAIGFDAYPTTLLLDREHRIYRRWVGTATKRDFEAAIEELLSRG
jgi:thiol-disulfide isomerase/thioredoxin